MIVYDISRGHLTAPVYPGDPHPKVDRLLRLEMGDDCNTSALFSCVHAGTHVDAPYHYLEDGEPIDKMPLDSFVGECVVVTVSEALIAGDVIESILSRGFKRILFRGGGKSYLSQSAAFVLASEHAVLVGTDSMSIESDDSNGIVHRELLSGNVSVLEGLDLSEVRDGKYFLVAPPVKIEQSDGAPARAILLDALFFV